MALRTTRGEHQRTGATSMRLVVLIALAVTAVCACSTGGMRYHTLSNYANIGAKTSGVVTSQDSNTLLIEVLPVKTSEALSTTKFMIGHTDGTVTPVTTDEWIAPFPDELRTAISQALQQRLSAVDLYVQGATSHTQRIQIATALIKADFSMRGRFSGVVEWSVKAVPSEESVVGRTSVIIDIVEGPEGQVTAFQKLSNSVAGDAAVAARTVSSYMK